MNLDGSVHFPTCRRRIAEQRAAVLAWYEHLGAVQLSCSDEEAQRDKILP